MKKLSIEVGIYMTDHSSISPEDLTSGDPADVVRRAFISTCDSIPKSWTRIGGGTLTFDLSDRKQVQQGMIDALKAQLNSHRAQSQLIENQILGRINDLQSLPAEVLQ